MLRVDDMPRRENPGRLATMGTNAPQPLLNIQHK